MVSPRPTPVVLPIAIGVIGLSAFLALPVFVGGLVDGRGFTSREAGLISSVEMGGLALGSVIFLLLAHRLGQRTLAFAALLAFAAGNLATPLMRELDTIIVARCLSGIGGGAALAVATAALSRATHPDRVFSIFIVAQLGFQAVALWLGPVSLQVVSIDTLYLLLGLVTLGSLPFIGPLPRAAEAAPRRSDVAAAAASPLALGLALLAMMLLFAATGGVWTYLERMGAVANLKPHEIGMALGASGIAGVAGPSTTLWLSRHDLRRAAIVGFVSLLAVSQVLLMQRMSFALYAVAACAFNFAWNALIPYYYGVLAEMDATGRAAVAGNLLSTIGLSAGAAVAASLSRDAHFEPVLSMASLACLASGALLLPFVKRVRPVEREADAAAG